MIQYAKTSSLPQGELEITGLNRLYLKDGTLNVKLLGRALPGSMQHRGCAFDASDFVRTIEKRQGIKISAPEEIAYRNGWIDEKILLESAVKYGNSPYGEHLKKVAEGKIRY